MRLGLPLVVVVYDDAAYGAEVHHFGPDGVSSSATVRFPDDRHRRDRPRLRLRRGDRARPGDLAPVRDWLAGPRDAPLVIDAKVAAERGSWWLEEAFRGH